MNITPVTPKKLPASGLSSFEDIAYVINGRHTELSSSYATVGIILLHDASKKNISIKSALESYTMLYSDKIFFACSDGKAVSENIQSMFPSVCFLSMPCRQQRLISVGALLNTLFSEVHTDLVFVSWTHIQPHGISTRMLLHAVEDMPLCVAPLCENSEGTPIPVSYKPKITIWGISMHLDVETSFFSYTFFPHDFVGIFNRKKVLSLHGFDPSISVSFWQLCDFAIRAYASGHYVRVSPCFRVKRLSEVKHSGDYKKDYVYHCMCLKYAVGLRLFHIILCFFSLLAGNPVTKLYKKYVGIFKNTKSLQTFGSVLKKKIAEYW